MSISDPPSLPEMGPSTKDIIALWISVLCGWTYTFCWSLSFYPQPWLNIKRKTTSGLTPDFPLLNVFGFSCYTLSTIIFMFSPLIRDQYAARHPVSPEPTVRANDLAFGAHAMVMCVITYSQFYPWIWGWTGKDEDEGKGGDDGVSRHANKVSLGLIWGSLLAVLVLVIIVLANGNGNDATGWSWIDVIYSLSYIKLLLTFFKYFPQALSNYRRQSTAGWAIAQVLLDFSGSILSLVQLVIDSALQDDWSGLTGNPMKFGLAQVSILFNVVFLVQHYVLYGSVEEKGMNRGDGEDGEREALLARRSGAD